MEKFINELPILTSTPNDYLFLIETDGLETYNAGLRNILADTKEKLKIAVRTEIVNSILKIEKEIVLKPTITQSTITTTVLNTIDLNYDGFYNTTNTYRVDCYISGYTTPISSNTASIIDCSLYVKNDVVIGVTTSNTLLQSGTQTDMVGEFSNKPIGTPSGLLTIESITPLLTGSFDEMKIDVNKSAPGGVISFKLYSTPHTDLITKIKIIAKKIG